MSRVFGAAERLMGMSDDTWRRHANPWSGWTRFLTTLPLLSLAIWARAWIGGWAVLLIALALGWIWLNPRAFPEPRLFDRWMSRGVLGEYVFIRHRAAVAPHHLRAASLLSLMSVPGAILWAAGLWIFRLDWVVFGAILAVLPKAWFVDRMVWIWQDWRRSGRTVLEIGEDRLV